MISHELINGSIEVQSKQLMLVIGSRDGHVEHRFH